MSTKTKDNEANGYFTAGKCHCGRDGEVFWMTSGDGLSLCERCAFEMASGLIQDVISVRINHLGNPPEQAAEVLEDLKLNVYQRMFNRIGRRYKNDRNL